MATGIPHSKLTIKGSNFTSASSNRLAPSLQYPSKLSESEILAIKPAECVILWPDKPDQIQLSNHRLYYGDNLPILASFINDNNICGKVKLIYIDPPFATKSIFQSRSQNHAYTDLLSGSEYIEFLRQRLIFLRELLANDGSIYLHLDDNMACYIKVIMDEIFGSSNFRNWITRRKCSSKNYTRKTYGNVTDYILFYTKSDDYIWHRPLEAWTPEKVVKEYEYIEPETGRRYKKVPIHAPGIRNGETGKPWRGIKPPPGKHWQLPPNVLEEMDTRGEIYWSKNGNPRRKIYFDDSEGIPISDIWLDFRDAHNQNVKITGYPTEKNANLLARIIASSSNSGDLVLDCFSGSGTTLDVAGSLGRKWIGIDCSLEAIGCTLRRLAKGCEIMGDFVSQKTSAQSDQNGLQSNQLSLFDVSQLTDKSFVPLAQSQVNNLVIYADRNYPRELYAMIKAWQAQLIVADKS